MNHDNKEEAGKSDLPHDEFRFHEHYKSLDERNEEIAGELTADDISRPVDHAEQQTEMDAKDADENHGFGWFALALSVIAFFLLPFVLGAAGIVLGFMARQRNARTLGNVAIVVGLIAVFGRLLLVPYS